MPPRKPSPTRALANVRRIFRAFETGDVSDAADYLQKLLSKPEQQLPHWKTAVEALIIAAELRRQQSR